jgi:2,4-dienoyl-CoA reductase-like NADH-dependent reductase (Old Yellow Enzyme family)
MHLAPRMDSHDMGDSDGLATFTYVARELAKRRLAFLCAREARVKPGEILRDPQGRPRDGAPKSSIGPAIKEAFGGVYITNESFTFESATAALADGVADAVAFGKLAIANPDLPERFAEGAPPNAWNGSTFYSGGASGYVDYPARAVEPA